MPARTALQMSRCFIPLGLEVMVWGTSKYSANPKAILLDQLAHRKKQLYQHSRLKNPKHVELSVLHPKSPNFQM